MGFIIESPTLARRISNTFLHAVPDNTYQLGLSDSGHLYWIKRLKEGGQLSIRGLTGHDFLATRGCLVYFVAAHRLAVMRIGCPDARPKPEPYRRMATVFPAQA